MKKVAAFSALLVFGLVTAKFLPDLAGANFAIVDKIVSLLTLTGLGFIMIHVGYEFEIDKSNLKLYGWDYLVAMTAAAFPWVFVSLYFVFVMLPSTAWASWTAWTEILLAGRFSAPTSAGVLFSMLAAAGLSGTWLFRKARVLAIFDDLDTVLLMIPLKMMIVGIAWQLGAIVLLMIAMLWLAWRYLHQWSIPTSWPWVLTYAVAITLVCELVSIGATMIDDEVPIHIEVLLPAFVLGCMMRRPAGADTHRDDAVRIRHPEMDIHIRVLFLEVTQQGGQHVLGDGGARPDDQHPPDLAGHITHGVLHLRIEIEYPVREFKDPLTRLRQADAVMGTVEQTGVEILLKLADLEGHGGLRHVQALRRLGEAQQTGNGMKNL